VQCCSNPPVPAFDAARTLMITDLGVVEDPGRTFNPCTSAGTAMGAWTFGYLATQIANQAVTGVDPADLVLDWLGMWDAPQVVSRIDLAGNPSYGHVGGAEGPATTRSFHELDARAIRLAQLAASTYSKRQLAGDAKQAISPLPPIAHRPALRAH
jgi:hypothetical protein